MSSFHAILDACVLYPAAIRDVLLRAAEADLYRAHFTEDILDEVRRNVAQRIGEERASKLANTIRDAFPEALVTGYDDIASTLSINPKDRHVLAAAIVSGAEVIVTDNRRHFPAMTLREWDVEALTADEFLVSLFDLDPVAMPRIIQEAAMALQNPPLSLRALIDKLRVTAPAFAAAVTRGLSAIEEPDVT